MNEINGFGVALLKCTTASAAGTNIAGTFDTSGYDSANIYLQAYNDSTASSGFVSSIILAESDTVTSYSSMTAIVEFTGGTATSTSVGFVIADQAAADSQGAIELQVDLRKRKKYISLYVVADAGNTNFIGGVAVFGRPEQSKDTSTLKKVINYDMTNSYISQVVAG